MIVAQLSQAYPKLILYLVTAPDNFQDKTFLRYEVLNNNGSVMVMERVFQVELITVILLIKLFDKKAE